VTYISADQGTHVCYGRVGESVLDLAHDNDIDLEGLSISQLAMFPVISSVRMLGACEGSLACSTCHVIIQNPEHYNHLPEPTDEENDMLDLAFGLTDTSRLGCQVKLTAELHGLVVKIPSATRNMAVDGYKPKPH
jgi:ferredoxin